MTLIENTENYNLSLKEFCDVTIIKIQPTDENEKKIYNFFYELRLKFIPLLKHYIYYCNNKDDKISINNINGLWLFFFYGILVKKFNESNFLFPTLPEFDDDDFDDIDLIIENPLKFQLIHQIMFVKERLIEFNQLRKIFETSSDPIAWFIRNNNSFILDKYINEDMKKLFFNVQSILKSKFNPLYQL